MFGKQRLHVIELRRKNLEGGRKEMAKSTKKKAKATKPAKKTGKSKKKAQTKAAESLDCLLELHKLQIQELH